MPTWTHFGLVLGHFGDASDHSKALCGARDALGRFLGARGEPWDALGVLLDHVGMLLAHF